MPVSLQDIKTVSYLKANAAQILDEIGENPPMAITHHGEVKAVLVSAEDYQKTNDTLAMLQLIALGDQDIREGRVTSADQVMKSVKDKIATHRKSKGQ